MAPSIIVDDRDGLVKAFVGHIEKAAVKAIGTRGRFTIAVTGGRDAQVILPRLASAAVDWARTDVFWGDERNVAPDDPESNYGQIKGAWLDHVPLPAANVHRMAAEAADSRAGGSRTTPLCLPLRSAHRFRSTSASSESGRTATSVRSFQAIR